MYSDDMADACIHLMNLPTEAFDALLKDPDDSELPPLINIGVGEDLSILELSQMVSEVVGFEGKILLDLEKPDGTPRKLMDVSRLAKTDWRAQTALREGLKAAYQDFWSESHDRPS